MLWHPSLLRIPGIVLGTVGVHIAITPPRPPPAKSEHAPSGRLECILDIRTLPFVLKIIIWLVAIAEVLTVLIFCNTLQPNPPTKMHILLQSLLMHLTFASNADAANIRPSCSFAIGVFLAISGGCVRQSCYEALGRMFTFELSIMKDHRLVTTGPYSVVRHPGYSALLMTSIGLVCMHASRGSYLRETAALTTSYGLGTVSLGVLFWNIILASIIIRIPKEETALKAEFKQDWDSYAAKVPYKLIPYLI